MAGGTSPKKDPKKLHIKNTFGNESQPESQSVYQPPSPHKLSLRGILGLGQTIEFNKPAAAAKEIFSGISHLHHEQSILFSQQQKEQERAIQELRDEVKKLATATNKLDKVVTQAVLNEIPDANQYQVNFFVRLRQFLVDARQSISEASLWVEAFAAKKKKKNYFWNTANNKKKGGQSFMFSDESSVARSVG